MTFITAWRAVAGVPGRVGQMRASPAVALKSEE